MTLKLEKPPCGDGLSTGLDRLEAGSPVIVKYSTSDTGCSTVKVHNIEMPCFRCGLIARHRIEPARSPVRYLKQLAYKGTEPINRFAASQEINKMLKGGGL